MKLLLFAFSKKFQKPRPFDSFFRRMAFLACVLAGIFLNTCRASDVCGASSAVSDPYCKDFFYSQYLLCYLDPYCPLPFLRNGKTWSNVQLVMSPGNVAGADSSGVSHPVVIKDGSTYKMWYRGTDGPNFRILYAESSDGKVWQNHQVVLNLGASGTGYDSKNVWRPYVKKEGSLYRIWYEAEDTSSIKRILYAESSDGKNWGNFQLSLDRATEPNGYDSAGVQNPDAVLNNNLLLYTGTNGTNARILKCTQTPDGAKSWSNCKPALLPGTEGTGDTFNVASLAVFQEPGHYKIWYSGSTTGFQYNFFYCETQDFVSYSNCQLSLAANTEGTYDTFNVEGPTVLVENGVGKMWYTASNGTNQYILYAESY